MPYVFILAKEDASMVTVKKVIMAGTPASILSHKLTLEMKVTHS